MEFKETCNRLDFGNPLHLHALLKKMVMGRPLQLEANAEAMNADAKELGRSLEL